MSTSTSAPAVTSSTSVYASGAFWERLWRLSGIQFVVLFIIAYLIYESQPQVGASADVVVGFYERGRTRILIAAVISGMAVLTLMWFAAALAYSIAGSGNRALTTGLNDFAWAGVVLSSFPRAMLIMSSAFGLWRAGLLSNAL